MVWKIQAEKVGLWVGVGLVFFFTNNFEEGLIGYGLDGRRWIG